MPLIRRAGLGLAIAVCLSAAGSASAAAATRFADPAPPPSPPANCPQSQPCDIVTAINGANNGDEVVVNPGQYGSQANPIEQTLDPPFGGVSIHGVIGQPRPLVISSADQGFYLNQGETLRWLEIQDIGTGAQALVLDGGFASGEQVIAQASGTGGVACEVYTLLRNSICWSRGAAGFGVESFLSDGLRASPQLRNVTAVATGQTSTGLRAQTVDNDRGTTVRMSADNVIAMGSATDVAGRGQGAAIDLDSSNFGIRDVAQGAQVTAPGSGSNQIVVPVFQNIGAGNFIQCATSPTLDAGITNPANGAEDVAANPRTLDGKTDIGAFEGSINCTPPVPPGPDPGPGPDPDPHPDDNSFQFGKLQRHPNGAGTLFVFVPGSGSIELRDVRNASRILSRPGTAKPARVLRVATRTYSGGRVALRVVPTRIGRRSLKRSGRLALQVTVTYTPVGGNANPENKQIKLIAKR
jgi:hypothetical protein